MSRSLHQAVAVAADRSLHHPAVAVVAASRSRHPAAKAGAEGAEEESGRNRLPAAAVAAVVRQTLEASSKVRMIHACIASA